jgi:hypothetical protein
MPARRRDIESLFGVASPQVWRGRLPYVEIVIAAVGAFVLAWLADLVTGRRGLFATSLVSGVAAVAGWFLAVRVFAIATMTDWIWVVWAMVASALALGGFFLFRSKR